METTTARAIAKDAYIYGYPLVDSYRVPVSYTHLTLPTILRV